VEYFTLFSIIRLYALLFVGRLMSSIHDAIKFPINYFANKRWRITKGQSKMDNPEKLATWGKQDE
jgi:hypothetical protein